MVAELGTKPAPPCSPFALLDVSNAVLPSLLPQPCPQNRALWSAVPRVPQPGLPSPLLGFPFPEASPWHSRWSRGGDQPLRDAWHVVFSSAQEHSGRFREARRWLARGSPWSGHLPCRELGRAGRSVFIAFHFASTYFPTSFVSRLNSEIFVRQQTRVTIGLLIGHLDAAVAGSLFKKKGCWQRCRACCSSGLARQLPGSVLRSCR